MTSSASARYTPESLLNIENLRERIDIVIEDWLAEKQRGLAPAHDAASELVAAARRLLARGKRMRPALCYWAWRAHGGENEGAPASGVATIGAALELFQAAALVHDDVMDDSDTRRGLPAAHRAFESLHSEQGLAGSAAEFGMSAAILLGDLLLIGSAELFARGLENFPETVRPSARSVFNALRLDVTIGQYLDVYTQTLPWGENPQAELARAREVVREKSARYSVEQPLMLGAALAGGDDETIATMSAFGLPLGEAFQLRDDLLDLYGDAEKLGKPAGADLREGKRTVVVTIALARASAEVRERILQEVGRADLSDDQVMRLCRDIADCGAQQEVEDLISALTQEAFSVLAPLRLEPQAAPILTALARAVVERSA